MQIFGEKMYMGNREIFVENQIDIKGVLMRRSQCSKNCTKMGTYHSNSNAPDMLVGVAVPTNEPEYLNIFRSNNVFILP